MFARVQVSGTGSLWRALGELWDWRSMQTVATSEGRGDIGLGDVDTPWNDVVWHWMIEVANHTCMRTGRLVNRHGIEVLSKAGH